MDEKPSGNKEKKEKKFIFHQDYIVRLTNQYVREQNTKKNKKII
jgi:hypothetical protein